MLNNKRNTTANIGFSIVGQIVENSTLVILFDYCAKVRQTFFKSLPIAKPLTLAEMSKSQ
jgi:hypothetical protein